MASILVVDDDAAARELVTTVLGYAGHETHQTENGAQALEWLQGTPADLVIVDLLMPTMDGPEFVRKLREDSALAAIPVVFYTASYLESEARGLASACGVTHVISKPAEPQQIFDVVNAALQDKALPPPQPAAQQAQQEYLHRLTAELSKKAAHVVPRLESMISLGLRLASERDPERLLDDFCNASRQVIGAQLAIVAVRNTDDSLRHVYERGLTSGTTVRLEAIDWNLAIYRRVFETRQPYRLSALPGDPTAIGLPAEHPPVHAMLCVPVQSPLHVYGWLVMINKAGTHAFDDEDEALAQILAAQVGRIYENGSLYRDVKCYAERLEAEIIERKGAQEEIRALNAELERRIEQRTAELREANVELEAYGYTISHDLRAPLRALNGYAELVLDTDGGRLTAEGQRYLRLCIDNSQRMSHMVDDLLAFSRLGRAALSKRPLRMAELVREVWQEVRQQDQQPAQLQLNELPPVQADRSMLREVWANLISNALKYSRKNPERTIVVSGARQGGELHYTIKDNGAGFDMAHVDKLFRVFERLHSAKEFEGTGAGLAIVERIIRRHGGRVWAESEIGKGATFHFTLPSDAST